MAEHSKDYHDYVFRDGKLIAEFEAMYRYSLGVPWHQDEQDDWIDVRLTVEMLRGIGPFDEIHDLGCDLGYYLALMHRSLGATGCRGFGYDIAGTACAKAKGAFPGFNFQMLDLTSVPRNSLANRKLESRRLFIIRGTLWYVFPHIAQVVRTIRSLMVAGDRLLVVQNFPPLDGAFIGKDVIPNHVALMRHFAAHFVTVRHLWCQDTIKAANDNWFIGLFTLGDTK